jgi:Spy/CpxP family protein refolding chaperone
MSAYHLRATRTVAGAAVVAMTATAFFAATPARAVSCDDVRALTKAEQVYWSKKLNLSAEQRHRIYQECYGQARLIEAKDSRPASERAER